MKNLKLCITVILVSVYLYSCAFPAELGESGNKNVPIPGGVIVRIESLSSVTISWNPVPGAASYSVFRSLTGEDGSFARIKTTQETTWTDTGLSAGTEYYYRVSAAVNNAGEGKMSAAVSACPMLPLTPANVRAEAFPASGIVISWDAAMAANSYNVYRADSIGGPYDNPLAAGINELNYTDSNISAGNEYYYKVAGENGLGEGMLSLHISCIMPLLTAPTNVRSEVISPSRIDISWDETATAVSYRIYRADSATGIYTALSTTAITGLSYVDNSVTVDHEYYYKVMGINKFGESELSAYTFSATTLPPVPSGVSGMSQSESQISVSWNTVPGALSYKLYRARNSDGPFTLLALITASNANYTDSFLEPNTEYFYCVSAVNGIGESGQSGTASAVTRLSPPHMITAAPDSATSIGISWAQINGAISYNLYRSTDENGPYELITATSGLSYTDTISDTSLRYYYKVSAVNINGESALSVYASAEFIRPDIPTGLSAFPLSATSLTISWDQSPGASSYNLYHSNTTATGTYNLLATVTDTSFTHTGLIINTDYFYRVSAVNIIGEGERSAYATGRITAPATPTNVRVEPISHDTLRVSWNPVPGALMYSVYRRTGGTSIVYTEDIITSTTDTYYIDTGRNPFSQYSYGVSATNDIGTSSLTATAVSAYTQPIPLEDGVWYSRTTTHLDGYYSYEYYSFPVNGGSYFIQWGNVGHTAEMSNFGGVSAYWKSTNSMTALTTSYFVDQMGGLANPRRVDAPDSGYIIIKAWRRGNSSSYNYDIRFYRE